MITLISPPWNRWNWTTDNMTAELRFKGQIYNWTRKDWWWANDEHGLHFDDEMISKLNSWQYACDVHSRSHAKNLHQHLSHLSTPLDEHSYNHYWTLRTAGRWDSGERIIWVIRIKRINELLNLIRISFPRTHLRKIVTVLNEGVVSSGIPD